MAECNLTICTCCLVTGTIRARADIQKLESYQNAPRGALQQLLSFYYAKTICRDHFKPSLYNELTYFLSAIKSLRVFD